jgi:hypothetical protein
MKIDPRGKLVHKHLLSLNYPASIIIKECQASKRGVELLQYSLPSQIQNKVSSEAEVAG